MVQELILDCIAALDVGTTNIRCKIFDKNGKYIGSAIDKVKLHYPQSGYVEINPTELYSTILNVLNRAIKDISISQTVRIKSLGLTTQRATFLLWRKSNGKPFGNFITWKDLRAHRLMEEINKCWKIWMLRKTSWLTHLLTRQLKFYIVSNLAITCKHVSPRLLWLITNKKDIQTALLDKDLLFGTLDTWLLYKLTNGKTYVTEISNASATGMFDPFSGCWSSIMKYLLNIPLEILPKVVDSNYSNFGDTDKNIFGYPVKIGSVMADQSASMYGSYNFKVNDLKITLGTGVFIDINTGDSIAANINGTYPLIAWKLQNKKAVYMTEMPGLDAGSLIEWMVECGLINDPTEANILANIPRSSEGVYFIPAFSGLGPPINSESAASGFIGIKPHTGKEHLIRAVLESIVYKTVLAYNSLLKKINDEENSITIKVDGGVSNSDFICQLLADLTGVVVERLGSDMATLGIAYLAGISSGLWEPDSSILQNTTNKKLMENIFLPTKDENTIKKYLSELQNWQKAAQRFTDWY